MALCFIEPELLPIELLHCGNMDFRFLLLLWPWPWPDDLHIRTLPLFPGDNRIREYELLTSRLWKALLSSDRETYIQTDGHTDRETNRTEIMPHRFACGQEDFQIEFTNYDFKYSDVKFLLRGLMVQKLTFEQFNLHVYASHKRLHSRHVSRLPRIVYVSCRRGTDLDPRAILLWSCSNSCHSINRN